MTLPRQVIPGATLMVQRRTLLRKFYLKPSKETNNIFRYTLLYCAQKYGIDLHEYVAISNHYHVIVTDNFGELPNFERDLNSLLARALNTSIGRWENFWSGDGYSAVRLTDGDSVIDKSGYVLANPVEAGLVSKATAWGGCTSAKLDYGDVITAKRPKRFFSKNMPEKVSGTLVRPSISLTLSDDALRRQVVDGVRIREQDARRRIKSAGGRFLGMSRVYKQSLWDSPATQAPRRGLKPTVAGPSKWARIAALTQRKEFLEQYFQQKAALVARHDKTLFPAGTFGLRAQGIVRVDTS